MSSPTDFKKAREDSTTATSSDGKFFVCSKPYYPKLIVDPQNEESIKTVAKVFMFEGCNDDELLVTKVTGGITNALFKVTSSSSSSDNGNSSDSVLVRIFGAEGMIDRDIETATFAALAEARIAPAFHGRFGNGRVEGWLHGYAPLKTDDLSNEILSTELAKKMTALHQFKIPDTLKTYHSKAGMWDQLFSWMEQALAASFKTDGDTQRASNLNLLDIKQDLHYLKESVVPQEALEAFCHNDLLAANIMYKDSDKMIHLIDFEYGGLNYIGFDIANHFNEWAGGTEDGVPDYSKFPSKNQQYAFVKAYLDNNKTTAAFCSIENLLEEVQTFVLANHLYWGLWAVNQASAEGCEDFDYLLYAHHRLTRFRSTK